MSNPSTPAFKEQIVRSNILTNETSFYLGDSDAKKKKKTLNTHCRGTVTTSITLGLGDPTELEDRSCQMTSGLILG